METELLSSIFEQLRLRAPDQPVLRCRGRNLSARELDERRAGMAQELARLGVRPGDRVAIILPKSVDTVAAMAAILQLNAIYVPIDRYAPHARIRAILRDSACRVAVTSQAFLTRCGLEQLGLRAALALEHEASDLHEGRSPWQALARAGESPQADALDRAAATHAGDVAFILYTSGSTGIPKGVSITHRNLRFFIDWCVKEFAIAPGDVMANHSSFTFDISTMIYAGLAAGCCTVIYTEDEMRSAAALADSLERDQITLWYSVPSILQLMIATGVLQNRALPRLRVVAFAGEVFPMKYLRELVRLLPGAALYNLYGPTETNVCTYHRVVPADAARETDLPIGRLLPGLKAWIVDESGGEVSGDQMGELVIGGPCVTPGYWNAPPHRNSDNHRRGRHATGDLVTRTADGFVFRGRLDNMVKIHGYRVELGEIENVLCRNDAIAEAAVMLSADGDRPELIACLAPSTAGMLPGLIEVKQWCARFLPPYMLPQRIRTFDELPKNPNGKIDRRGLRELLATSAPAPAPAQVRAQAPAQIPAQAPARAPAQAPAQIQAQVPAQPGAGSGEAPRERFRSS